MEELDIGVVRKRSVSGVFALVSRTFTIQIIGLAANFLLTIYLSPSVFGVFFVVSAAIAFLSYFSDIGLAAALIQKKEKPSEIQLRTTFTIQQVLVIFLVLIALVLSNKIGSFYKLDQAGILLFQALVIAFFLSSLKTIPSIILERNLRFEKLVIPQIVENLFFNITAVILAVKGFGITSFTIAVLARGLSGVLAMYIISPWRIRFGFSKDAVAQLVSFGIPFQTNSLLALVKDDLLIAYLGKVLPISQVGYIGFAQKWALMPIRLIMDNVIRVTFPSFSRLQSNKDVLRKAVEKSIFAACLFIFPALAGLVVLAPYFINIIPKYTKWEPALISLTFFSMNAALSSISTPLTNALNAVGKITITLYLMILWTAATWILTPIAIIFFGFNGVSIASALIATSLVLVIYLVKKHIDFSLYRTVSYPFLATLIMGIVLYFASQVLINNLFTLILMIIVGGILYFGIMILLARQELIADIRLIKRSLTK